MKKLIVILLLGLNMWIYGTALGLTQKPTINYTKVPTEHKSVVNVAGMRSQCTGFVGKRNYIVTAKHCVKDGSVVFHITYWDGTVSAGVVVYESDNRDLAVIKADTRGYPAVAFAPNVQLSLGDQVYHVRYIQEEQGQHRMNGVYGLFDCSLLDGCYHFVGMAGVPGDSGGALFLESTGEVIGVTSMSYWPFAAPMSMFAPIEEVVDWLEAN